jgi:hypothetical protein
MTEQIYRQKFSGGDNDMRQSSKLFLAGAVILVSQGFAQQSSADGLYKVLKTAKVGGEGGFDYVYADAAERRLYVPFRPGKACLHI